MFTKNQHYWVDLSLGFLYHINTIFGLFFIWIVDVVIKVPPFADEHFDGSTDNRETLINSISSFFVA